MALSSNGRVSHRDGSPAQTQSSSRGGPPQGAAEPPERSAPAQVPTSSGTAMKTADAASIGAGSSVSTPGAVKPPPGVRASSVGLFLARLRAQDAQAAAE